MMKELMEMLAKKGGSEEGMDDSRIQAKMDVLEELKQMASGQAGEGIKQGMQEVSVMAPDKEGMVEGLEMAQQMAEAGEEMPDGMAEQEEMDIMQMLAEIKANKDKMKSEEY